MKPNRPVSLSLKDTLYDVLHEQDYLSHSMFSSPNHIRIIFLPIALKVPDKKSPESDMYGSMTHNQNPPSRALQVRILIPMGASG